MSWWLTDVARAKAERTAIAQLSERDGWLSGISWRLGDDLHLIVDFDVQHGAETFGLSMTYPSTFPDTPPMVQPRDERRLSWHQYGPGGELCLEFRPDNWAPSITGAMMVESAHRLLSGERPGENEPGIVRSAHQASIGRETRGEFTRFILNDSAATVLAALPVDVPTAITVWDRLAKPTWVASLMSVGEGGILWAQNAPQPSHSSVANGFVIRTTRNVDRFRLSPKDFAEVMPVEFPDLLAKLPKNPFDGFVLLGNENHWVALNLYPYEGKQSVFGYKIIVAPSVSGRLPAGYASLAQKRIAIVGCGSVGSKIASTLARSGVSNFTLVDDDVFFQANLVRNDLDAQAIGQHKVDALAARLQNLVANADISVRRIALGQQESAGRQSPLWRSWSKPTYWSTRRQTPVRSTSLQPLPVVIANPWSGVRSLRAELAASLLGSARGLIRSLPKRAAKSAHGAIIITCPGSPQPKRTMGSSEITPHR